MKQQHKSQFSLHANAQQKEKLKTTPKSNREKIKSKIISDQDKIIQEITLKKHKDASFPNIQRRDFNTYASLTEKCNPSICPSPNSCVADYICKCSEDRANFDENAFNVFDKNTSQVYCSYIRKKQLIAFVLEFVFISTGHFYIGSYLLGCLKLFSLMGAILANHFEEKWSKILSMVMLSIIIIWWVVDTALFSVNYYSDSNKIQLMEW